MPSSSGSGSSKKNDGGSPFDPAFWSWNRWTSHAMVDAKGSNKDTPPSLAQRREDLAASNDSAASCPLSSNPKNTMKVTGRKEKISQPQEHVGRIEKISELPAGTTSGHGKDHHEPRRGDLVKLSSKNEKGGDTLKKVLEPVSSVGEYSPKQKAPDHHPVVTNPELRSKNIHDRPQKSRLVADLKHKRPVRVKKPELNVQVALTRQEIEEDLLAMTGMKPSRRPQQRPKELQRLLDVLFPGTGLNGITEDTYKVNEGSSRKG